MNRILKNFTVLTFLMLISLMFITTSAGTYPITYDKPYDFYDSEEANEIYNVILESQMFNNPIYLEQADRDCCHEGQLSLYKMYKGPLLDPVSEFLKKGKLTGIKKDDYVWVGVTDSNTGIIVQKENGVWDVAVLCQYDDPSPLPGYVQMDVVNAAIESLNPDEVIIFQQQIYYTQFVYMLVGNNEYLIPFSARPEFSGLEIGKIYSKKEVGEILSECEYQAKFSEQNSGDLIGGQVVSINVDKSNIWYIIVGIAVGCCLVGAFVVFIIRKNKRVS